MKEQESGPGSPPEVCAGDPMAFGARYLPRDSTGNCALCGSGRS